MACDSNILHAVADERYEAVAVDVADVSSRTICGLVANRILTVSCTSWKKTLSNVLSDILPKASSMS